MKEEEDKKKGKKARRHKCWGKKAFLNMVHRKKTVYHSSFHFGAGPDFNY